MSRYSTRYDSSNSYKSGLDPGNLGSYRSSNLSTYSGGLGHSSSRSDRFGSSSSSYSSGPSTSSSSRLHGSYSSTRSSVVDSVPLPRSTSFGRSEVLSSSTPRDPVDKGSYSSSLSRTSSLPTSTDEPRSGRYSSRGSALTSNHSLDTGTDAAAERRLRLAQRRRQREEGAGGSETGSDNSKEPSLERSSSLRRDSDSDSGLPGSGQLSRRWAGRRMRESSLTEESEGKDSSPDVPETGVRRARNLRGASGSSEDSTTALAPASSLDSVPPSDEDAAFQRSSEARRSRRQQRLEEASRQASGSLDEGTAKEAEASTRPWRRRLQEQGITTATDDTQSSRRRSRDGEAVLTDSTLSSSRRRSQDLEQENGSRRRSQDMTQEGVSRRRSLRGAGGEGSAEEAAKLADAVASEVETRTERIARYKEERRKQLAHIASITSPAGSEEKESEALPSLFTAAKREKEGSPSDSAGQTASETEESGGGGALTLSSRLRAMRTGSEEMLKDSDIADGVRARDSAVRPEMPAGKVTDVKTRSAERDKADKSSSAQSSTLPDKTATTSRKSPSPASTRKPLTTSTESVTTRRPSAGSREPSPKKMSVSSVSSDKPGRRTSDSSTDSRAGRKPSDSSADSRAIRKPSDGSLETRKSKSPSPVSSRLLAATRSSAAKEAVTAGKGSPSPRSSPSPRGSPAPSDRTSVSKPATGTVSSRGPPRIKQSLMPERGAKDTAGPGVGKEETREEQALSKSTVRLFKGAEKASDKVAARESPEKTGTAAAPKLSSSSFSAASSTRSTDRDSGFGSSRLSSSSFSSNRSTDKDTYTVPPVKPPRLQRTAHVDVSSSSSREGSEEKQITGSQAASSVNRTSALPSRATTSGSQQAKTQGATDSSRTQAGERKLSSSSRKEEPTVPKDLPLSQRLAAIRRASSKEEDEQGKSPADRKDSKTKVPRNGVLGETASSSGSMGAGLDDILAKNAEFLSSDEEAGAGQPGKGKGKGERRQLRAEEEPRLRRSLRKKFLHKSGSSSRDSPARESKETEAETDITVTLPTSDVKETLTSHVAAKSDVSAKEKDDAKKGVPEALQGEREGSKEGTPDSDSVFETAPSTPRVDNTHSRVRPEDKTGLRKSALNKAADSLSHRGRDQGKEEGEKEDSNQKSSSPARAAQLGIASLTNKVSDIRNRFAGGLSSNEKSKSDKPDKASGLTRHHSRGKDFSQLLQKFSSNSEASSSERSDSDSGHRLTTLRRGDTGHSSSDDAQLDGSRRTPERSHSLRVARSAAAASPKESKEKGVERSSSFKSDFMKKRFSPVPQDDKPSAELSAVLSRRQEEVQKQQEEEVESDKRGDRRQARAEKFKAASVEEVIADNEVAAVLKARRKETDSKAEAADPGFTTIEQSLDTLARVTHELGEDKEPSPETERLKPVPRSEPAAASKRKTSKESIKEAEQLISDVETRISSSLHLSDKDTPSKTISEPCKKETTKTVSESCKKETAKTVSAKDDKVSVQSSKEKKPSKEPSDKAEKVGSKDSDKDTTFTINTSAFSPVRSPERESSIESTTSSSSSLRRAESLKEQSSISRSESFERRKGILKRTPSASKSDRPVIDPQLARIMEQRRLKELEMEEAKEEEEEEEEAKKRGVGRLRARSAAEEIEESVRVMRESHQGDVEHQEEEALLTISVSERISRMQTLATTTEERHVPKPRSGTTTPKRAWSGGATPRKQISVDEGVAEVIPEETTTTTTISGTTTTQDEVSSTQLIARLNSLWTKSKDFEDRRHKFQKRQRDDWRTRTQPVTLEEIQQADGLTLAEKVKLFSQKQKEEAEAATTKPPTRSDAPVRRRGRKLQPSRFQTQPVTPEELEKASKISPLAMSLVKPPDPELLAGMKLKDQQELMMMHAEATLSQCSSRAGSRPSSQPGSRRSSFTTPETLQSGGEVEGSEKSSLTTTTTTTTSTTTPSRGRHTGSQNELTRSDSEPRGILKKIKSTESVPTDPVSSKPISTTTTTTTTTTKDKTTTSSTKSTESLVSSSVKDTGVKDTTIGERDATRGVKETSTSLKDSSVKDSEEDTEGDRASPVAELILPVLEAEVDVTSTTFFLTDDDIGGESTTDPVTGEGEKEEEQDVTPRSRDSKRRSRFADRKGQAERYLTQPSPQFTPSEKSPPPKRKYEGRHMTQPITADEMTEAESATTPVSKVAGGSISERLNQLKTSGEENWKRKVMKDGDTPLSAVDVKLREKKGLAAVRPTSISDRLCKLDRSAETWKERVEETDAKHFTVANKLSKSSTVFVSESPLVAKIKASSKKDLTGLDDSSNTSSPVTSPSTPTKEFLPKVPLPKEIIADPVAVKEAAETKSKEEQKAVGNGVEEGEKPVRVEVPSLDHEQIEEFFSIKEITEISDKVEMDIDDFNNIFVEANEILQSVKKIRPTRKTKARSRNPLKTVSQFVEIQTEYTQVNTGAAENQLRKMKTDALKRDAGLAVEALAALSSKENFSNVALRKTEQSSSHPALALQQNPFSDLMLLHVKGRRNIQTRLVEPSGKSINAGDCYLLVTPDKVIVWVGEYSNIIEKAKAAEIATFIQQKKNMGYKGVAGAQTVDQAKDHLGAGKPFWNALSGDKQCQACGPDEEDELYENAIIKTNMVYKFTDGALKPFEEYWGATPRHEMLNKKEVLVFDFGTEFYVWQGVSVSLEKRKQSMALAQKLWDKGYDYSECAVNPMGPLRSDDDDSIPLKASKRPEWAIFGKVNQNMETILFREKFADWPDNSRLIGVKEVKATEQKIDLADIKAYDAKKMIPLNDAPVSLKLDGSHVGRGKKWQEDMQGFIKEQDILTLGVRVWHVMEYDHYEVPETSYGQFHRGDTYVVRWQYMITNAGLKSLKGAAARQSLTGRERCAYFFWQGQDSTVNEKGASALMTVELDEERGPQVRVVQGKEPPCFLNLFEGSMVLHIGKREDSTTNTAGPWRMYSVRGDKAGEVCLLEIPVSISNLRSRSSLVLLNTRTGVAYVWHGVKSPKQVRQLAVAAVKSLKEKRPLELDLHKDAHIIITEVEEGEEKSEIWTALDSRNRSLYHSLLKDGARYDYTPRLFYMTSVSMVFEVTEQMNPARLPGVTTPFPFFQTDLYNAPQPALFLMDVGKCVYLWQGWWPVGDEDVENVHTGSAAARFNIDRRCAMETTLNYSKEQGSEAYLVCAGVEPLEFQNLFPYWEPDATVCSLALQEGKKDGWCERVEDVYTKLTQARYTFEELQERPLPEGVDPLKLETYLADEEFEEVLEMSREEFYQLPSWKQKQTKQSLGLY
ncbi:supervillin-like isoform X3 [Littorina saxatilis]|uniref:supervillin-like isoform X3 n=1 Tax=Littorina saxatilis TaxID=31220 RepID=UPI0038B470C3